MATDNYKWQGPFPEHLKKKEVWPSLGGNTNTIAALDRHLLSRLGSWLIVNSMISLAKSFGPSKAQWRGHPNQTSQKWSKEKRPKDFGRDSRSTSSFDAVNQASSWGQDEQRISSCTQRLCTGLYESVVESSKHSEQYQTKFQSDQLNECTPEGIDNQTLQVISCAILIKLSFLQVLNEQLKVLREPTKISGDFKANKQVEVDRKAKVISADKLKVNKLANFGGEARDMDYFGGNGDGGDEAGYDWNGQEEIPRVPDFREAIDSDKEDDDQFYGELEGAREEGQGGGVNQFGGHFDGFHQLHDEWMEEAIFDHAQMAELLEPVMAAAAGGGPVLNEGDILNPMDVDEEIAEIGLIDQLAGEVVILHDLVDDVGMIHDLINELPADAA